MLYDNTTVKGSWIQIQNMTELSKNFSRIVNNVTMAMPHSGVFEAAMDPFNDIMQPRDLSVPLSSLHPNANLLLTKRYNRASANTIFKPQSLLLL